MTLLPAYPSPLFLTRIHNYPLTRPLCNITSMQQVPAGRLVHGYRLVR